MIYSGLSLILAITGTAIVVAFGVFILGALYFAAGTLWNDIKCGVWYD